MTNTPDEIKPVPRRRNLPPLVIAGLLFAGSVFPAIRHHQRETDEAATAISEGASTADGFLNALNEKRYPDAFSMLAPDAQSSMSPTALKKLAQSMRAPTGQIIFRRDPQSTVTMLEEATDKMTIVTLHYYVQPMGGEKQVDVMISQTPDGIRIESCSTKVK